MYVSDHGDSTFLPNSMNVPFFLLCVSHMALFCHTCCGVGTSSSLLEKKNKDRAVIPSEPWVQTRSQVLSYLAPGDGAGEDLKTRLLLVLFLLVVMSSPEKLEPWNKKSRESVVTPIIGWFSNRTGTLIDDGALKSNNWLDQWLSGKLGTGSRVYMLSFPRAFPSSNDVPVLLLNQPNSNPRPFS